MYKVKKQGLNSFYIDEIGSRAIVNRTFYIDGVKAPEGTYALETIEGIITIKIDKEGKVIE